MPNVRTPSKRSKWYLPKHRYLTVYHYCLQYPEWEEEYKTIKANAGISAVNYDGMPHGGGSQDPTSSEAIRLADIDMKMQQVRDAVHEAAPELYQWLLKGVTEGWPFWYLKDVMKIPCERDMYYDRRRKFYFLMAKRLWKQ